MDLDFLYLFQVAKSGGGALAVRNSTGSTLSPGPVRVTGYDAANAAFLIANADAAANTPASMLLSAALNTGANGTAYLGATFTSSIDTTASTIGNAVYLAVGGGVTLTAPSGADQIQQVVGRVQTLANPGVVSGLILAPIKFGTSWIQNLAITNALLAAGAVDLTTKVSGVLPVANGGTNSGAALSNNQLMASLAGVVKELGAMTDGQMIVGKTGSPPQIVSPGGQGDIGSVSNTGAIVLSRINGTAFPATIATGDLLYASATNTLARLSHGNNGSVLRTVTGIPTWQFRNAWSNSTSVTAPDDDGKLLDISTSGANQSVTLPSAATAGAGFVIGIRNSGNSGHTVTITPNGTDRIGQYGGTGIASYVLSAEGAQVWLMSTGNSGGGIGNGWAVIECSGDYVSTNAVGPVTLPINSTTAIGTLTNLPAGEWDLSGQAYFTLGNATGASAVLGGINTSVAAPPSQGDNRMDGLPPTGGANVTITVAGYRVVISAANTYYLVGAIIGATGTTSTGYGRLSARRIR